MTHAVFQIGAGGTGACLAPNLARLAAYHPKCDDIITIADGDKYEEKNITRQPIGGNHAETYKAIHLADTLLHAQGLKANACTEYVDQTLMQQWLDEQEGPVLVVCAVDNNATRRMTIDVLTESSKDFFWVSPANADDENGDSPIKGQVLWYGRKGARELGANPALIYEALINPTGFIPEKDGCAEHAPSHPQLLSANLLSAAWAMTVIQNYLDNRLPKGHAVFFDGRAVRFNLA